ncbi:MAG: hypothetical protein WDA74_04100 [Spirochaetota bacterium]
MRIFISFLFTVLLFSVLYSQEAAEAENTEQTKQTEESAIPTGYGEAVWGTFLTDVREKISGRLVFTDDKTIIKSRDGDLEYDYGFFYKDPLLIGEKIDVSDQADNALDNTNDTVAADEIKDEGTLFYVSLKFPYLNQELVYNKIKEKYGIHSSEDIKDNQGAIAWDSDKTVIVMWIDQYEGKPYCRRIVYVSKEIAAQLNEYHYAIFNKREIELIKQLNP